MDVGKWGGLLTGSMVGVSTLQMSNVHPPIDGDDPAEAAVVVGVLGSEGSNPK